MQVEKALIIDEPWIGSILDGEKDWEMRTRPTSQRGWIGLVRKGSLAVHGAARLVDCGPALGGEKVLATFGRHRIPEELVLSGKSAKWNVPWVLEDAFRFPEPVPYVHRQGAVIWVRLDREAARAVGSHVSSVEALRAFGP